MLSETFRQWKFSRLKDLPRCSQKLLKIKTYSNEFNATLILKISYMLDFECMKLANSFLCLPKYTRGLEALKKYFWRMFQNFFLRILLIKKLFYSNGYQRYRSCIHAYCQKYNICANFSVAKYDYLTMTSPIMTYKICKYVRKCLGSEHCSKYHLNVLAFSNSDKHTYISCSSSYIKNIVTTTFVDAIWNAEWIT